MSDLFGNHIVGFPTGQLIFIMDVAFQQIFQSICLFKQLET